MDSGCANTDRELWRTDGGWDADKIHVTVDGGIGINVGGLVIVKPLAEWHKLALADLPEMPKLPIIDKEPQRCAECNCENGGKYCNWIKSGEGE